MNRKNGMLYFTR